MVMDIYTLFSELNNEQDPVKVAEEMIVVTPNHVQRRAVKQLLNSIPAARNVLVDTVEKAQGKTSDLVVLCYGIFSKQEVEKSCDFSFTPSRLNVSLSRARAKVIVLAGDPLNEVPAKFIRDTKAQQGYKLFLHAIEHSKNEGGYQELIMQ
jgi:DNA replication ATP-dependent helicase Dna2